MTDHLSFFLRFARSGNLEKVKEYLDQGIDVDEANQNGLNALHLASKEGRLDVVREILSRGARVDKVTNKGNSALHIACLAGHLLVVQELLQHGADVNIQSKSGFTPLYMAAQENHVEVVSHLLKHGANPSIHTEDGFTPLAVAIQQKHERVVTLLLENDTRGRVRMPALHLAARKDDVTAIKLLVSTDANVNLQTVNGFTPLHVAVHHGSENAVKALVAYGADVNFQAKNNITPLHVAAKIGRLNILKILLESSAYPDAQNRDGLTPLHCAARSGHVEAIRILLDSGAKPDVKTKNGLTPLHMSAQGDHIECSDLLVSNGANVDEPTLDLLTPLHVAAHCGTVTTARYLLNNRCNVNARALNGFTALHVAVKKMRIKVVELLLRYQANIHATTETGLTALSIASFIGYNDIVVLLLKKGANIEQTNLRCETALHLATRNNQVEVMNTLIEANADINARATENLTPLHFAARNGNIDCITLLLKSGADVNALTKDNSSPLHLASREGKDDAVELLIRFGADVKAKTRRGLTPLAVAAKHGRINVARRLILAGGRDLVNDVSPLNGLSPLHVAVHFDHSNMVELLLDQGADLEAVTSNGYTPLHIAAKRGLLDVAELLLMHAASARSNGSSVVERMVTAQAVNGCTPLHLAAMEGHKDMCSLLLKHGAPVNNAAQNGVTSLHLACQEDRVGVSEVLLAEGADVSPQTKSGYTPLHTASHYGRPRVVQLLLSRQHPVNVQTYQGSTPLHVAAQNGHFLVVKMLLEEGQADPNLRNSQGLTAAHIAFRQNQVNVYNLLRELTTIVESWETEEIEIIEVIIQLEKADNVNEGIADSGFDDQSAAGSFNARQRDSISGYGRPVSRSEIGLSILSPGGMNSISNDEIWKQMDYFSNGPMGDDSFFDNQDAHNEIVQGTEVTSTEEIVVSQSGKTVQSGVTKTPESYTRNDQSEWSFDAMNINILKQPVSSGFLVSFVVDARGGVLQAQRHHDLRIIVPPNAATGPTRIICRLLRPQRLQSPVPLNDGNGLACRILEMGPSQVQFSSPVLLEIPFYASLRNRERELVVFRSDNGDTWKEHPFEATEQAVQDAFGNIFDSLPSNDEMRERRILRVLTRDLPVYFAVISRYRQECSLVGEEGGIISSSIVNKVQAIFPEKALQKRIKVGLQAQAINPQLCQFILGDLNNQIYFSPIVTIEPRRRKFHRPITLTIPLPGLEKTSSSPNKTGTTTTTTISPELHLLCSITGGSSPAQWEDITGSTPLSRVRDCVTFTTTVSARFWLVEWPKSLTKVNLLDIVSQIYQECNRVPYIGSLAIFARRCHPNDQADGEIRALCTIDDTTDKTLECQQEFTLVAHGPPVEFVEGQIYQLEVLSLPDMVDGRRGSMQLLATANQQQQQHPISDLQQRGLLFPLVVRPFYENRSTTMPVVGNNGKVAFWQSSLTMRQDTQDSSASTSPVVGPPLVTLEVQLPKDIPTRQLAKRPSKDADWQRNLAIKVGEEIARSELDLMEVANMVGGDWIALGQELGLTQADLHSIQFASQFSSEESRALEMLTVWQSEAGERANGNELARCLRAIGRDDIVKTSMHNIVFVTSEEEKNQALERIGSDQPQPTTPGSPQKLPKTTTTSVVKDRNVLNVLMNGNDSERPDESMIVEPGGEEEDKMRADEQSLDESRLDDEERQEEEEDSMIVPTVNPNYGVITKDEITTETPEAQQARQEAYLSLIDRLEDILPDVHLPSQEEDDHSSVQEDVVKPKDKETWSSTSVSKQEMAPLVTLLQSPKAEMKPVPSAHGDAHISVGGAGGSITISSVPAELCVEADDNISPELAVTLEKEDDHHQHHEEKEEVEAQVVDEKEPEIEETVVEGGFVEDVTDSVAVDHHHDEEKEEENKDEQNEQEEEEEEDEEETHYEEEEIEMVWDGIGWRIVSAQKVSSPTAADETAAPAQEIVSETHSSQPAALKSKSSSSSSSSLASNHSNGSGIDDAFEEAYKTALAHVEDKKTNDGNQ